MKYREKPFIVPCVMLLLCLLWGGTGCSDTRQKEQAYEEEKVGEMEKAEETVETEEVEEAEETKQQSEIKVTPSPGGIYWEGDVPPEYAGYYVEISNVTDKSFDFVIYGKNSQDNDYGVVFKLHTAEYKDSYTAVCDGKEYTLTFQWQEPGYMTVTGFEEWIPEESSPLYNTDYLGVS